MKISTIFVVAAVPVLTAACSAKYEPIPDFTTVVTPTDKPVDECLANLSGSKPRLKDKAYTPSENAKAYMKLDKYADNVLQDYAICRGWAKGQRK